MEGEIGRLVAAIAGGQPSKSLTTAIAERERELKAITDRLLEPGPGLLSETIATVLVSKSHFTSRLRHDFAKWHTPVLLAELIVLAGAATLLVPQAGNGVQFGCQICRIVPKEDPDTHGDRKSNQNPQVGERCRNRRH